LAGALLGPLGVTGLLLIDLVSAAIAIGALLVVQIPQPVNSGASEAGKGSFREDAVYGFRYIFQRPSLLGLQTVFLVGNFFAGLAFAVMAPMILGRSGNDELVFGSIQSVGAIGGVVGGVAMSIWGGPKRRVHGVLLGWVCTSILGQTLLGLGRSLPVWSAGMFFFSFFVPILNGSNQAIWQAKVAPDVQGRVFSARRLIAQLSWPLATLLAGPMADFLFEPAMAVGGPLANRFGGLVGTGAGAGMSLMFVVTGLMGMVVGLGGYAVPAIRNAEEILPDHDAAPEPLSVPAA
jgi:hypothetical protein